MADELVRYNDVDARLTQVLYEHSQRLLAVWLFEVRVTLCDLLQGRIIRARAEELLASALELEADGFPREVVSERLDSAAHLEWIAGISETGQVYWGGRKNRQGKSAEDMCT